MEVEIKFGVPNEEVFQRLMEVQSIAEFPLSTGSVSELRDLYLDTADWALHAAGYACRLRRLDARALVSLKGLGGALGALHRREEYEVGLPGPLPPADWPPSPARDLVLRLCGNRPLRTLFEIRQTRHSRRLYAGKRAVAEVSLDRVTLCQGQDSEGVRIYLELEAELLPEGREEELGELALELERSWNLRPESRSKYERALAVLGLPGDLTLPRTVAAETEENCPGQRLTAEERAVVERLTLEREVIARRARLLLAWDEAAPRTELVRQSGLSPRRVRYWLRRFSRLRLGVFPSRALGPLQGSAGAEPGPEVLVPAVLTLAEPAAVDVPLSEAEPGSKAGAVSLPPSARVPAATAVAAQVAGQEGPAPSTSPRAATKLPLPLPKLPGIEADDPMSEAGRKTLRFHFQRMLFHEPGTRQGEDIEALHDMRVATRRMRAAFRIFEPYFEREVLGPHLKGLRRTGDALGAVRDLDVFREKIQIYLRSLPDSEQTGLDDLLAVLERQRAAARDRMIAHLDGGKHRRFVERFGEFVNTEGMGSLRFLPGDGEPRPTRVRHVVPMAIYERLAEIHGYDEWVTVPQPPLTRLHALRIACKRFRYTVEFVSEVLGPSSKGVIKEIVTMQDHLGALQDAVVASGILRDYLIWGTWGADAASTAAGSRSRPDLNPTVVSPGVAAYLTAQHLEMRRLLDTFPAAWQRLQGAEFSQMVAQAVMVL